MSEVHSYPGARMRKADVAIIGAGMAGLTAAVELRRAGRTVLVIDKGRGVGGRLATRRIGDATFDHGAQFVTATEPRFAAAIEEWRAKGILGEWYRSAGDGSGEHIRWRGKPGMTAIAKDLATDVPLLLKTRVVSIRRNAVGWVVELDGGDTVAAGAALLTAPIPQSLDLIEAGGVELPSEKRSLLKAVEYERCFAVMAVPGGPVKIPEPGGLAPPEGAIAWIADNQRKGVSGAPAVTLHATAAYSLEHWDRDRLEIGKELLRTAEPWLGSEVREFQVQGWRYSRPTRIEESSCMILSDSPPLLIAGDVFGGPRIEGAALSGWAAAGALSNMKSGGT